MNRFNLNFSIFIKEVLGKDEESLSYAQKTLKEALEYLEKFDLEADKDSTAVLELIKDNIELWNL